MVSSVVGAVEAYVDQVAPAVAQALAAATAAVPTLAARFAAAGVDPAGGVEALNGIPVLSKDDVLAQQRADPPFGGLLAADADVARVYQSPGPLYEPMLAGPDPWRWAPALQAAGIGAADLVLNCFGYHLSPAGAMFDEGARAVGARVLPGGIGNQDLQAAAIADLGVSGYTGLPSYLKALIERYDDAGLPRERWRLAKAVVTAEPLPDSLRAVLQKRVPTVLMAYGTAEAGLIGYEDAPGSGLLPAPGVLVQVCSLDTGLPVVEGEGEVVVTVLRAARLAGVAGVSAWQLVIDRVDHLDQLSAHVVLAPGVDGDAVCAEVARRVRDGLRFTCTVVPVPALEAEGVIRDARDWS